MTLLLRSAWLGIVVALSACSTLNSAGLVTRESPRAFTGTQLNIAAIGRNAHTLAEFERFGMRPAAFPVADLPFSFALDVVLLPFVATRWIF